MNSGVPKGSILGLHLYIIYPSDLPENMKSYRPVEKFGKDISADTKAKYIDLHLDQRLTWKYHLQT